MLDAVFPFLLLGLAIVVCVAIYAGSVAWAIGDAQARGYDGGRVVLLFWFLGPISALIWLLIRPAKRLIERPLDSFEEAEDALAAATRLDSLGDWDAAIALYRHTAERWPEHADYARQCLETIIRKKSLG